MEKDNKKRKRRLALALRDNLYKRTQQRQARRNGTQENFSKDVGSAETISQEKSIKEHKNALGEESL